MHIDTFKPYFTSEYLMGPNSIRILEELLQAHPLSLSSEDTVLDLGCGKGLTSFVLSKETDAAVCAADLWIAPEENTARFDAWGVDSRITAVSADANALPFAPKQFRAMVSVDAYHYFGTPCGFFAERILPYLDDGAAVLIGVPGIKEPYTDQREKLLGGWLGEDAYMFRSPNEWKTILGAHERIAEVQTWEMACFETAWQEWFATGHKYAVGDRQFYDTMIAPYTCFVGIFIRLK